MSLVISVLDVGLSLSMSLTILTGGNGIVLPLRIDLGKGQKDHGSCMTTAGERSLSQGAHVHEMVSMSLSVRLQGV